MLAVLVAANGLLAGCSAATSMNPANWWHQQEGGKIAQERPAPPGAEQAFPNLATVPAKPAPADPEAMKKLTDSLVADRTNAQHEAQSAPLADPSSPTASPALFGVGSAPPPAAPTPSAAAGPATGPAVASASIPAVSAPATAPAPAPRRPVQNAPLTEPEAAGSPPPAMPAADAAAPASGSGSGSAAARRFAPSNPPAPTGMTSGGTAPATIAGPSPDLPAGPPPRPAAAGVPPAMPVVAAPMPAAAGGPTATIVFLERASNLTAPAADEVKAFAGKRGKSTISVVGYGDATSSNPEAQSAALNLGLERAQSIVEALKADGVPGEAIRVSAEASGRGAALQLIQ